jgi:hypothetical protein
MIRILLCQTKGQATGHAFGDTGWFEPDINPVHAVIAFDDLARLWIPLGCAPGAGDNASLAAHAGAGLNKNDAIAQAPLHRPRGASFEAPSVFTMKTGHEGKAGHRQPCRVLGRGDDEARR